MVYRNDAPSITPFSIAAQGSMCYRATTLAAPSCSLLLLLRHLLLLVPPFVQAFPIPRTTSKRCPTHRLTTTIHSSSSSTTMRSITGLREIVDDYDVFLLDMWGVLHDGTRPYTGVLEAVQKLRSHNSDADDNKKLIVLSNSSKPQEHSRKSLLKLGFDPDASFDTIITSGQVCKDLLSSKSPCTQTPSTWWSNLHDSSGGSNRRKTILLGSGEDDLAYCRACGWDVTASVEEASLVLARGTMTIEGGEERSRISCSTDPTGYATQLESLLVAAAQRRLPMLVANPDKIRPDAARSPMPGAIGERYREVLGDDEPLIERIGKPFPEVYTRALEPYQQKNKDDIRVLMVGDALETDVVGGAATGIDTLWVLNDGVFAGDSRTPQEIIDDFNQQKDATYARGRTVTPTMWMPHFRW